MKRIIISAALLTSGMVNAATPIDGLYASAFGGYSYIPDNVSRLYFGNTFTDVSYNSGYHAGGRFGYQSHPLRYELEVTFIHASTSKFYFNRAVARTHNDGQNTALLGMANIYYDFPEMVPCIAPFVGLGLGYGWIEAKLVDNQPYRTLYFKGSGNVFAYQGTAGLTYNFAENYALNIAYRYVGTDRVDNIGKVFQANLGTLGVIYRFDEANYK